MPKQKKIDLIEKLCKENGLNIYEVFRKSEVPTNTIFNWRKKEPKAFADYDRIIETIYSMKQQSV